MKRGDAVEVAGRLRGLRRWRSAIGVGELLELRAGEQADVFAKRAEAARIDTQAVASGFCVAARSSARPGDVVESPVDRAGLR